MEASGNLKRCLGKTLPVKVRPKRSRQDFVPELLQNMAASEELQGDTILELRPLAFFLFTSVLLCTSVFFFVCVLLFCLRLISLICVSYILFAITFFLICDFYFLFAFSFFNLHFCLCLTLLGHRKKRSPGLI